MSSLVKSEGNSNEKLVIDNQTDELNVSHSSALPSINAPNFKMGYIGIFKKNTDQLLSTNMASHANILNHTSKLQSEERENFDRVSSI